MWLTVWYALVHAPGRCEPIGRREPRAIGRRGCGTTPVIVMGPSRVHTCGHHAVVRCVDEAGVDGVSCPHHEALDAGPVEQIKQDHEQAFG